MEKHLRILYRPLNTMFDLKGLLELMHTNNDSNVQVQLFATLSAYIMSNEADIDQIITHNSMYDKICNVLITCPPRKTIVMFNFLSALVYTVDEDYKRNSLVVYAKNMIRSSGCLATLCESFTSCMMHQDAWRSLCQCLAEICRNVETNQSYCTHLVPTCVHRCSHRNIEVLLVLQSLLQNHPRNVSLFIECNGISIFQRELLQHDSCLQLLNTLVQSSKQAIELISRTDVYQCLRDFLHLYGPQSQVGQWATIILYHMSETKGGIWDVPFPKHGTTSNPIDKSITDKPNLQEVTDTTRFLRSVMKEIALCGQLSDLKYVPSLLISPPLNKQDNNSCKQQVSVHNLPSDTICAQNTSSKVNDYKPQKRSILNRNTHMQSRPNKMSRDLSFSFLHRENNKRFATSANKICDTFQPNFLNAVKLRKTLELNKCPIANEIYSTSKVHNYQAQNTLNYNDQMDSRPNKPTNDLSFSFLYKQNNMKTATATMVANKMKETFQSSVTNAVKPSPSELNESLRVRENFSLHDPPELNNFIPKFASTPKKQDNFEYNNSRIRLQSSSQRFNSNKIRKPDKKRIVRSRKLVPKTLKRLEQTTFDKKSKHRSISGWLFDAVNESCTTLVKTVKNIFRQKNSIEECKATSLRPTISNNSASCSYSFMNYMRKRDAILKSECTKKYNVYVDNFSREISDSCSTCNDTTELKQKLATDEHLKQTVRKLKLGINLYGCDFKKISKLLWPQQSYMTPVVLYNIYRKLILK